MTLLDLFFLITTVVLGAGCFVCYKSNKPLRDKAKAEKQAAAEKLEAEAKRLQREAYEKDVEAAVELALKTLFSEARDYSYTFEVHEKQRIRQGCCSLRPRPVRFNQETREVFHKVLRVGALEERVDRIEEGNKARREDARKVRAQLDDIHRVIEPYA